MSAIVESVEFPRELRKKQIELEESMVGRGKDRYFRIVDKAKSRKAESTTTYGARFFREMLPTIADGVRALQESLIHAGRYHRYVQPIRSADADVLAYITLRIVLDQISRPRKALAVAREIGIAVEQEAMCLHFDTINPGYFNTVLRDLEKRNVTRTHKATVVHLMLARKEGGWSGWPNQVKLNVGLKLLNVILEATDMCVMRTVVSNGKTFSILEPSEAAVDFIRKHKEHAALLSPVVRPFYIPPAPWKNAFDGAFYTARLDHKYNLIKTRDNTYLLDLHKYAPQREVLSAVNAIQNTPWRINKRVYEVMRAAWIQGSDLGGLPMGKDLPVPEWVMPPGMTKETMPPEVKRAFKDHKQLMFRIHTLNTANRSKYLQQHKVLEVAQEYIDVERFYYAYQLDFRGRIYSLQNFLSPQSTDTGKALLEFADGDTIDTEEELHWLMVHGANVWGEDKVSLEDRVQWVKDNEWHIRKTAQDPMGYTWWSDADKPYQFLAFCFEYADFLSEGFGFRSRLAIAMDGTCNGLQHLAAILRDARLGRAVNLLPGEKPSDIYQDVADVVTAMLQVDSSRMALELLAFGINRKLTKRPVMVVPYGGTFDSCRKYVAEYIYEKTRGGTENPFSDPLEDVISYAAKQVWIALGEVVKSAKLVMKWLQKIARITAKYGAPLEWTTPCGFVVRQTAYKEKRSRINTYINGSIMQFDVLDNSDKEFDEYKQANGVSPNYIHSNDAACLMKTVNECANDDMYQFAFIHDSYGTTAKHTTRLNKILREEFVKMYENKGTHGIDILFDFKAAVCSNLPDEAINEIPDMPEVGSMDIRQVRNSKFFFA